MNNNVSLFLRNCKGLHCELQPSVRNVLEDLLVGRGCIRFDKKEGFLMIKETNGATACRGRAASSHRRV